MTKDQEQKMMEEIAEFVFRFNAKYDALLDIKIKPMKAKKCLKRKEIVNEEKSISSDAVDCNCGCGMWETR